MENVNVTEEQAKKLKLFAYYAQGYGHNEVDYEIYLQDCQFLDLKLDVGLCLEQRIYTTLCFTQNASSG